MNNEQEQDGPSDTDMLDWLEKHEADASFGLFTDADGSDVQYPSDEEIWIVSYDDGDNHWWTGNTLREAIRSAMGGES